MLVNVGNDFVQAPISFELTGPRPKEIKVETFRIDYLIRAPKVEKLSLQPIRQEGKLKIIPIPKRYLVYNP